MAQLSGQSRPSHKMPTITHLPEFPGIPLFAKLLNREDQQALVQTLVNNKIMTWPVTSSRSYRAGKFTSTGIFDGIPPTEEQIARVAPSYDNILLSARNRDLIPRFKKYNPDLSFFVYIDSGLNPEFEQADVGSVDDEDTGWSLRIIPIGFSRTRMEISSALEADSPTQGSTGQTPGIRNGKITLLKK